MREFKKMEVWQKSRRLTDQLCRAVVSIAPIIAEGASRRSEMVFYRFLEIALGSTNEVECHLIMANDLGHVGDSQFTTLNNDVNHTRAALLNYMKGVRS